MASAASAVLVLLAALLTAGTADAEGRWTAKVLVVDGMAGHVIAAFRGAYEGPEDASDPGIAPLESTTPVSVDSRLTELFVPVGMSSAIWIWDDNTGYHFLGNVTPDGSLDPIRLDASRAAVGYRPASLAVQERASSASSVTEPSPPRSEHTTKVVVGNAAPGQIIAVFQGAQASELQAADPGIAQLESTTPVATGSLVTELFVPVGMASTVWIWDETSGYRLLGTVEPGSRSQPIHLDATQTR